MFKKWFNRRGYRNIFYYIAGIKSPSLWSHYAYRDIEKKLNKKDRY